MKRTPSALAMALGLSLLAGGAHASEVATVSATPYVSADAPDRNTDLVFNWIELQNPDVFPSGRYPTQVQDGYRYRHYPESGMYLGEKDGTLLLFVPGLGLLSAGTVAEHVADADRALRPKAGDPFFTELKVDGELMQRKAYRFYGLDDGNLVPGGGAPCTGYPEFPCEDDDRNLLPGGGFADASSVDGVVALLESVETEPTMLVRGIELHGAATPVDTETMKAFYKDLWDAYKSVHPDWSPERIVGEIADLDLALEELREAVLGSGLSMADYVRFKEAVDAFLPEDTAAEGDLHLFLTLVDATPQELVADLEAAGLDWSGLLQAMAHRGDDFINLYQQFATSELGLTDFLKSYVAGGSFSAAGAAEAAKVGVDAAKVAVDAAKLGLEVGKFAWEVIKDGRPVTQTEGAYTSIFSVQDSASERYGHAREGRSPTASWEGKNLFRMTLYSTTLGLSGYYGARHDSIGGQWLPSVAFTVDNAFAAWTWNLNASAAITSFANTGSTSAPVPEVRVIAKAQASGLLQNFTESFIFYANGANGFRR